jgi:endogenous inhibitor of DNA gyrase (YacG/DUF329 family)
VFRHSVITKTRQMWKLVAGMVGLASGSTLTICVASGFVTFLNAEAAILAVVTGLGVAILSTVFVMVAVRCPNCGARWAWLAARTQSESNWLFWLMGLMNCPECGRPVANEQNSAPLGRG